MASLETKSEDDLTLLCSNSGVQQFKFHIKQHTKAHMIVSSRVTNSKF